MVLFIDTSTENACAGLALEGKLLVSATNQNQQDHAAWLHPAIERLIRQSGIGIKELKAVAVTAGPGSYTGLRVSMAAAKGLCFALQIPLITENTLFVIALALKEEALARGASLICPMIDARRMEVFTALYGQGLETVLNPHALILDKNSFDDFLTLGPIVFSGSGAPKWQELANSPNALFVPEPPLAQALASISQVKLAATDFADINYAEPIYLKEFYTHGKK